MLVKLISVILAFYILTAISTSKPVTNIEEFDKSFGPISLSENDEILQLAKLLSKLAEDSKKQKKFLNQQRNFFLMNFSF